MSLVNRGDDADTTCAIAGGLLGADAIPSRWLDKLEYAGKMIAAAIEFARLRSAA